MTTEYKTGDVRDDGFIWNHGQWNSPQALERHRKHRREYYQKNRGRYQKQRRASYLKIKYGLSPDGVSGLREFQGGRCAICSRDFTDDGLKEYVDHCHDSNEVRGLLCHNCNCAIGHAESSGFIPAEYQAYLDNPPFSRLNQPTDEQEAPDVA